MISHSNSSPLFKKNSRLQTLVQHIMNRRLPQAMACGVVSTMALQSTALQAATIYFESNRVAVSEPQSGSVLVSIKPILTFDVSNDTFTADNAAWSLMEITSSPCTVSGSISAKTADSTATADTDYRSIEGGAFSLTTEPYFTPNEQLFFDDVSQEVLFEIMADDIEEGEEHIELEFSNLSVTCAEGSFSLTSANYGSTTISITPAEPEQNPSGPKPIPTRQKSLAAQLNSIRSLTLQTANTRNRSLSRELKHARQHSGFNDNNLQLKINGATLPQSIVPGSGAGDSFDDFGRWGFFVSGSIDVGTRKDAGYESLNYDSSLLIAGIDYRANDNLVLGSAISITIADMGSKSFAKTDLNSSALSLFASYYSKERFYVDAILTFGMGDYDLSRKIETTTNSTDAATASTDGNETGFSLGTGYNIHDQNRNFRLFTLVNYVDANVDGYTESVTGTSSAATVNDLDLQSLTADLGVEASWNINTDTGVYTPLMSVAFVHQYMDDAVDINGQFAGGVDQGGFDFHAPDRDNDYLNAQLGLSGVFKNGLNAYLVYDTDLARKDLSSKRYSIGVRWQY